MELSTRHPSRRPPLSQCSCCPGLPRPAPEDAVRIVSGVTGPMLSLARRELAELSPEARRRLKWIDWHRAHGENVSRTCRHFSIGRETFYRWWGRYDPRDLTSLEDHSSSPQQLRVAHLDDGGGPGRPPAP